MIRISLAVAVWALTWWLASELPAYIVYTAEQRMLEDRLRQLESVRQHEDEFSSKLKRGKPWK